MLKNSLLESCAIVCHEANRAYCKSIGDDTQPGWKDAPEWQKVSCRNGVLFHCKNPNAGAEASHDNWYKEKLEAGWSYGPKKDSENKKHPCMVPFHELPDHHQIKDHIFKAVVHGYLHSRGHYIDGEVMIGPCE